MVPEEIVVGPKADETMAVAVEEVAALPVDQDTDAARPIALPDEDTSVVVEEEVAGTEDVADPIVDDVADPILDGTDEHADGVIIEEVAGKPLYY